MQIWIYSTLVVVILFFTGCKKQDAVLPEINVTEPLAMKHFSYNNVISVGGEASDETKLKSVKIELVSKDQNSTYFSFEENATSDTYEFRKSFTLDDKHMPSGNCFIKVTAIDEAGNRKSQFKEIQYTELSLELSDVFVVEKFTGNYDLSRVNGNGTEFISTFLGDFQDAVANSYWGQLVFSGGSEGNLISYNPENGLFNWQIADQNTTEPYYQDLVWIEADKSIGVSRADNVLISFDKEGATRRTTSFGQNVMAKEVLQMGEYLFVEEQGLSQTKLGVYYQSTGVKQQDYFIGGDIVKIIPRNEEEIFLVTQEGGQAHLYIYYINTNSVYEPHAINVGEVSDAVGISDNEIIIAHQDGMLRFTYGNNSMVNVSSFAGEQIEYDYLNDIIYAASGTSIQTMDRYGNLGVSITHSGSIDKFILYYNK